MKEWNKTSGSLRVGDAVTAHGELAGETINMDSFWATVSKVASNDNEIYEITDANGTKHHLPRSLLRHRKWHNISCGHVSDDKVHDRQAM